MELRLSVTRPSPAYALLDSGDGEKLERYGSFTIARPDPQALWPKAMGPWTPQASYTRTVRAGWKKDTSVPGSWPIVIDGITFLVKLTPFKHTGVFPEQESNWQFIRERSREARVLNLFGYTGGATIAALQGGGEVTHVDASKTAVTWARENATLSQVATLPVRWIVDDARRFLSREIRRGVRYDGIIMDPPTFGHGPTKELWKLERDLLELFHLAQMALTDTPRFVVVSGYAAGYSSIAYHNNLLPLLALYGGSIESGELAIQEDSGHPRLLPAGIVARWKKV
jgi:23S rRNA (cytosine1962-C5)-methyltransferase